MRQTILDVLFRFVQILLRQNGSHKLVDIRIIVQHFELSHNHLIFTLLLCHGLFVYDNLAELCREILLVRTTLSLTSFDTFDFGDLSLHSALHFCYFFHFKL